MMYGCFDYKHLGFLTMLMEKLPILPFLGNGKFVRQALYVLDLCNVIISAMHRGLSHKVHDLIGKEQIYFIDILLGIKKKRGIKCLLLTLPLWLFAFFSENLGYDFWEGSFFERSNYRFNCGRFF